MLIKITMNEFIMNDFIGIIRLTVLYESSVRRLHYNQDGFRLGIDVEWDEGGCITFEDLFDIAFVADSGKESFLRD